MMKNKNKTGKQHSCEGFKQLATSRVKGEAEERLPMKDEEVHLLFSLLSTLRKQRQVAARGSVEGTLPGGAGRRIYPVTQGGRRIIWHGQAFF